MSYERLNTKDYFCSNTRFAHLIVVVCQVDTDTAMESHIGQHISQATEMQTLCWSKTRPSFSGADNSYIS